MSLLSLSVDNWSSSSSMTNRATGWRMPSQTIWDGLSFHKSTRCTIVVWWFIFMQYIQQESTFLRYGGLLLPCLILPLYLFLHLLICQLISHTRHYLRRYLQNYLHLLQIFLYSLGLTSFPFGMVQVFKNRLFKYIWEQWNVVAASSAQSTVKPTSI